MEINKIPEDVQCSWLSPATLCNCLKSRSTICSHPPWMEKNPRQLLLECRNFISKGFWDASRVRETWLIYCISLLAGRSREKGLDWNCQVAKENYKRALQRLDTLGHSLRDVRGNNLCPFLTTSRCQKPQLMEIIILPLASMALYQFAAAEVVTQQFSFPVNVNKVMHKLNKMHLKIKWFWTTSYFRNLL